MTWAGENNRAESLLDAVAAALFAAAVAFAAAKLVEIAGPGLVGVAAFAMLLAYAILRAVPANERIYALPNFEPTPIEPVLEVEDEADVLLLDDRLSVEPDSRVVQLFERRSAQGGDRQEIGLGGGHARLGGPVAPDASRALSTALAELRRSLR
jgi:hypothetical protein